MCAEACPASLLPQQLLWYSQAKDHDRLQSHNLFDCIECGACSYVCPSNIPLVQHYRAARAILRRQKKKKLSLLKRASVLNLDSSELSKLIKNVRLNVLHDARPLCKLKKPLRQIPPLTLLLPHRQELKLSN
jgi:Na+-translocating ferredoxin:NAD+ oxidoreductase RnfC subunit